MKKRILTLVMAVLMTMSLAQAAFAAPVFSDVPTDHPHKEAIEYCAKNKFILGKGDGTFEPDGKITREHLAAIWSRTFKGRQHSFNDVTKVENEMDNAIILIYGFGFIDGVSKTEYSRHTNITRQEVAKIVENTYLPGIDGEDAYKEYKDYEQIDSWAKNAVSVCKDKKIFGDIVGENFEPKKTMTRSEVCEVIKNVMTEPEPPAPEVTYSITIGDLTGGKIEADKSKAKEGETVTLTITPDDGKQLKDGTLKYNDETAITGVSFEMPAKDVEITAEFEDEKAPETPPAEKVVLSSIVISAEPAKTSYTAGEKLDLSGLVVKAKYSDDSEKEVTGFTATPANDTDLTEAMTSVEVSFTEDDITKTASFNITVTPQV